MSMMTAFGVFIAFLAVYFFIGFIVGFTPSIYDDSETFLSHNYQKVKKHGIGVALVYIFVDTILYPVVVYRTIKKRREIGV